MYIVTSYWIEGETGETIKTKEFKYLSRAEYYNKENNINDLCTHSTITKTKNTQTVLAKVNCAYCNS